MSTETQTSANQSLPRVCGNCAKKQVVETELKSYDAEFRYEGKDYQFIVKSLPALVCNNCGARHFDDASETAIRNAFREHIGLLSPEDIRKYRDGLGLSQKDLALYLAVAPESVSRWENDMLLQSRLVDRLLRTYFNVPEVRVYLKRLVAGAVVQDQAEIETIREAHEGDFIQRKRDAVMLALIVGKLPEDPDEIHQSSLRTQRCKSQIEQFLQNRSLTAMVRNDSISSAIDAFLVALFDHHPAKC